MVYGSFSTFNFWTGTPITKDDGKILSFVFCVFCEGDIKLY